MPEPGRANRRAVANANPIKLRDSTMRMASVSDNMKPAPMLEISSCYEYWILRSISGQRGETGLLGTWEIPPRFIGGSRWQLRPGINNRNRSWTGKSEGAIVASKPGNLGGAKGPWLITCGLRQYLELIGI